MSRRHDFATRLALARRLIARGAAPAPVHLADQLDAAGAETRVLHDRIGAVLPVVVPDRAWYQRVNAAPSDDVRAYLLAALLGCTITCVHLRRGGPQPAICRLPLRRTDCECCIATIRPSVTAADECDVCDRRGVVTFSPFAVRQGPLLLIGDACQPCAGTLGIRIEQEAS